MSRNKSNIDILIKVAGKILKEHKLYDQEDWAYKLPAGTTSRRTRSCDTVCCVAGWVCTLEAGPIFNNEGLMNYAISDTARELLDLDGEQAYTLFSGAAVDGMCNELGIDAPEQGTLEYAKIGVKHIDKFMRNELGYEGKSLLAIHGYAE